MTSILKSSKRLTLWLVILVLGAGLLSSCVPVPPYDPAFVQGGVSVQETAVAPLPAATAAATLAQIEPTGTPVTVTIALAVPTVALTPTETLLPTETAVPSPTIGFTATPAPTSTRRPTSTVAATSTPAPTPTATVDQHRITITEDDIAKAVAGGAGAQQGATVENLKVRFADGKTYITADRLGYGIIKMQNLDLVGRLVAQNGVLSLEVESIAPRGLAANFVPGVANQALANFASQWYVEEVRTLDGRVELRVR